MSDRQEIAAHREPRFFDNVVLDFGGFGDRHPDYPDGYAPRGKRWARGKRHMRLIHWRRWKRLVRRQGVVPPSCDPRVGLRFARDGSVTAAILRP